MSRARPGSPEGWSRQSRGQGKSGHGPHMHNHTSHVKECSLHLRNNSGPLKGCKLGDDTIRFAFITDPSGSSSVQNEGRQEAMWQSQ